jgi:hypothetical protein
MSVACLGLTIPGRRGGDQGVEKGGGSPGYFVDGSMERFPVHARWIDKASDLSYELQGRHPDFLAGRRRFEIIECLDIPTHFTNLASSDSERSHNCIISPL